MASLLPKESPQHPLQERFEERLRMLKKGGFNSIRAKVWDERNGGRARPGMPDPSHIASILTEAERETLMAFIRMGRTEARDVAHQGSMPTPRVDDVYGRVIQGENVRDLGTGNGARASNIPNITGYDITLRKAEDIDITIKHADEFGKDFDPATETATSFNALSSLGLDRKLVEGHNGTHVFPDVEAMARAGFAKKVGDHYETTVNNKTYKDIPLAYGTSFMPFYKSVSWFRPATVVLTAVGRAKGPGSIGIHGRRATGSIGDYANYPATYKYNGTHAVLSVDKDGGRMEIEGGVQIIYTVTGNATFNIDLEIMKTGKAYVTRVSSVGNIIPHHGLEAIHEFLSKITVDIPNLRFAAPENVDHGKLAQLYEKGLIDGIVARAYSNDYLIKYQQSIDVACFTNWDNYIAAAEEAGYLVYKPETGPDCEGPVCEYTLKPYKDGYLLVHVRDRSKKRTDTPRDLVNLLSHPTINGNPNGPAGRSKTTDEDGKEVN